jgi:hypothetical protein
LKKEKVQKITDDFFKGLSYSVENMDDCYKKQMQQITNLINQVNNTL